MEQQNHLAPCGVNLRPFNEERRKTTQTEAIDGAEVSVVPVKSESKMGQCEEVTVLQEERKKNK